VRFTDVASFAKSLDVPGDADGLLLYCLPGGRAGFERLVELAQNSETRERIEVLIAVPREIDSLNELDALRRVQNNTPELNSDAVARRELRSRLAAAEKRVAAEIDQLFSPQSGARSRTLWFHHGIEQAIADDRSLAGVLSDICDRVYEHTSVLRNELVNRRSLSTAAAKARRNLIEAMITRGSMPRLGFEGTPPEISIYSSLIESTGVHRPVEGVHQFCGPAKDAGLIAVWKEIERFFASCEVDRRPVPELIEILQKPPYGLKAGVIPVLLCAAFLAHDAETALYEDGVFSPEITVEALERLLRQPQKFEIRSFRIEGARKEVFHRLAELFGAERNAAKENIVDVMRPLYRFFHRLPPYARRTRSLSPTAMAIREALVEARDPDRLLFQELPRACGVEALTTAQAANPLAESFFDSLRNGLAELQRAYPDLLTDLKKHLFRSFGAPAKTARETLRPRAEDLLEHCVEPRLRPFVFHLTDDALEDSAWIEALATMVADKAPRTWTDDDRAQYEVCVAGVRDINMENQAARDRSSQ